uniref:Rabphilin-1 n=2 Tax=Meloidogyne hapla TaxID=6305 RepID=A0A1I8B0H1_MELHA
MNDWEIGGTQNPWVCPSDRHLQLRAQLKSGWSVRTATARSPTTSKQSLLCAGITEAEQEKIRKVLARAEQGRMNEQIRIGKMVERLDRLRSRAVGNGVTQCLLCQTEFGLLAAKSYAAMCSDCRKYVCQRNCGVETFDQKRKEPIFLCKICSEYREVMWKKSGAWFYKEVPSLPPSRPCSAMADISSSPMMGNTSNNCQQQQSSSFMTPTSSIGQPDSPTARSLCSTGPTPRRHFPFGGQDYRKDNKQQSPITATVRRTATSVGTEPVPIPSEHQQRLKTNPRPRIIPSWVHDGLQQSSISVDEESDAESASSSTSSSLEPAQFRMSLGAQKERAMAVKQRASINSNNSLNNQKQSITSQRNLNVLTTKESGKTLKTTSIKHGRSNRNENNNKNMQRVVLRRGGRNRVLDSDSEDQEALSRRSSPSISPRHSLATPSSYGGDDPPLMLTTTGGVTTTQNYINSSTSLPQHNNDEKTMSDSRSVDSGVVQSDHSAQQHGLAAFAASVSNPPIHQQMFCSEESNNNWQQQQHLPPPMAKSPSPIPPPIPPRSATIAAPPPKPLPSEITQQIVGSSTSFVPSTRIVAKRPSSANNNNCSINQTTNNGRYSTHETESASMRIDEVGFSSLSLAPDSSITSRRSTQSSTVPTVDNNIRCREDVHVAVDGGMSSGRRSDGDSFDRDDSPAFMSEPDDDINFRLHSNSHQNVLLNTQQKQLSPSFVGRQNRIQTPAVSIESVPSEGDSSPLPPVCSPLLTNEHQHQHIKPSHSNQSLDEKNIGTLGSIQLNLLYLSEEKQLIIHLIRAKNLKAMDKNGFSDPYVKFHLLPGNAKATKLTSKTIEKSLNPEWNQELIYYGITEEERLRKSLRVTVLDRDRIGADFLGETRIALRKLPLGVTKKFNLYLEHAMPTPLEKPIQEERGKLLLSVCYNIQQGSLFVTIKRCVELLGMDATGFSDPYCKVSLTPLASKAHRQKTAIKKRTLNPEFNETMQFLVPFKDLPKKTLDIGVYDYGGIVLSTAAPGERGRQWQQVIENPGKTFEYWHKLESDG